MAGAGAGGGGGGVDGGVVHINDEGCVTAHMWAKKKAVWSHLETDER